MFKIANLVLDYLEAQTMSGVKDRYAVHYPCKHCMVSKMNIGNVQTSADGVMSIKFERLRTNDVLKIAKNSYTSSKPETSLGFVLDRSRPVFDNIKWKYPFHIYCMTPMCILHVFLSHGIAEYAIQWTQKVIYNYGFDQINDLKEMSVKDLMSRVNTSGALNIK